MHKQHVRRSALSIAFAVAAAGGVLAQSGTAVKSAIRAQISTAVLDSLKDVTNRRIPVTCVSAFNAKVAEARAEVQSCLDIDNPPAGSPFAAFNAKSAAGQQVFCDDAVKTQPGKTCGDILVADQSKFCAINAAKAKSAAKLIESQCLACESKRTQIEQLKAQLSALEKDVATTCVGK
jgi:hypothetical protein